MNSRKDRLSKLFAAPVPALSTDNAPGTLRVSSGSVRSMRDSFSGIERENDELREAIAKGSVVLELEPSLIDPSLVRDRFDEPGGSSFADLKASIERHGQEVPILVRPNLTAASRFQAAYGHRRLQACAELGIKVRAVVRPLTDAELVVAQGLENAARLDLTFIERAVFALRLEDAGYDRQIVKDALNIDRAEASKLIGVARQIPRDIIEAIGRAPKIGRPRWIAFAELLEKAAVLKRIRAFMGEQKFMSADSDLRFLLLFGSASKTGAEKDKDGVRGASTIAVTSSGGDALARVTRSNAEIKLSFDRADRDKFAEFVLAELPALFARFSEQERSPSDV